MGVWLRGEEGEGEGGRDFSVGEAAARKEKGEEEVMGGDGKEGVGVAGATGLEETLEVSDSTERMCGGLFVRWLETEVGGMVI